MKKKNYLAIAIAMGLLFAGNAFGQEDQETDNQPKAVTQADSIKPLAYDTYKAKGALAINVASMGFGFEYAHNINKNLNGRLRANMLSINDYEYATYFSGQDVTFFANVEVFNFDLLLEYLPFPKSSFKLIGGASYINSGAANVRVILNNSIEYGEIEISGEEIGDIVVDVDYSGVAPYLGIGFGRAVPKRRVGLGMEMGAYYPGSPKVTLTSTGMLEPTGEAEGAKLEKNMAQYAWLPFINLRLAVRL